MDHNALQNLFDVTALLLQFSERPN